MGTFLVFLLVVAAVVMLFRHLRRKEVEAFRETDISVLEEFEPKAERKPVDPIALKAEAYLRSGSGAPSRFDSPTPSTVYRFRDAVFDPPHASFFQHLQEIAGATHTIFVRVPLSEFVDCAGPVPQEFATQTVSFLLCESRDMRVSCGIRLLGGEPPGFGKEDLLGHVFERLNTPLVTFSHAGQVHAGQVHAGQIHAGQFHAGQFHAGQFSADEIRRKLTAVMDLSVNTGNCPECGGAMRKARARNGRKAGRMVWVCRDYPGCRGMASADDGRQTG